MTVVVIIRIIGIMAALAVIEGLAATDQRAEEIGMAFATRAVFTAAVVRPAMACAMVAMTPPQQSSSS
ncbi:MAG: hypothetical protein E6Q73_10805 [Pseudorhodobacter sp.]|nr:MAG: hypothetical protein E6Q73_10805 [Pseudorhodobacter sp.]